MQPPAHHVAMMQIECEVINTKLIHIKEDAIPHHMMEAQQMMNNKSDRKDDNKNSYDKNKNASIESLTGNNSKHRIDFDQNEHPQHDDIHSYYHNGYNLSNLNTNNGANNESINTRENSLNDEKTQEDAFGYEIYANNSNGEYLTDEDNLLLNGEESPDSILQRSPGIVPRRFNKNAKLREPSFADSSTVNQNNDDKDGTIDFNP